MTQLRKNYKNNMEGVKSILMISVIFFLTVNLISVADSSEQTNPPEYASFLTIWTNQKAYYLNDKISIKSNVYNRFDEESRYYILGSIRQIKENGVTTPFNRDITLEPGEKKIIELYSGRISRDYFFENGRWKAEANIFYEDQLIETKSIYFDITSMPEKFEAKLKMCLDSRCTKKTKIISSTNPYFTIDSNKRYKVSNIYIKDPSGKKKRYTSLSKIFFSQEGPYEIEVSLLSIDGEKTTLKERFTRSQVAKPRTIPTGGVIGVIGEGSIVIGVILILIVIIFLVCRSLRKKRIR